MPKRTSVVAIPARVRRAAPRLQPFRLCNPTPAAAIEPKLRYLPKACRDLRVGQNQGGASCPKSLPDAPPDFAPPLRNP